VIILVLQCDEELFNVARSLEDDDFLILESLFIPVSMRPRSRILYAFTRLSRKSIVFVFLLSFLSVK
jgi:hypothetical protein